MTSEANMSEAISRGHLQMASALGARRARLIFDDVWSVFT